MHASEQIDRLTSQEASLGIINAFAEDPASIIVKHLNNIPSTLSQKFLAMNAVSAALQARIGHPDLSETQIEAIALEGLTNDNPDGKTPIGEEGEVEIYSPTDVVKVLNNLTLGYQEMMLPRPSGPTSPSDTGFPISTSP